MLKKIKKITANPKHAKLMHWGKLISITGSSQLLIQAIGFVCGILIIRLLPVKEYAFYTLANTMLGTMTILADGGISSGVMAQGGKVWGDKIKLGQVIVTGLHLRKKFALISLIISLPILFYLLRDHNASWFMSSLIVLSLIPAFYAALSDSLLQIVPKLHQNIKLLQRNQLEVSFGRLIFITSLVFFFPFTAIALLANGIPRIYGNFKLKSIAAKNADLSVDRCPKVQKEIFKVVRRVMPGSIYFAFSSQINIWLISFFGDTEGIAQIGVLSRFSIIVTFIIIIIETVFVPAFAKIKNTKVVFLSFFQSQIGMFLIACCLFLGFYLFDTQLLWLLGVKYEGLYNEIHLIGLSACVTLFSTSTNKLLSSRGIIVPPVMFIAFMVCVQVFYVFMIDLSTVSGIIKYGICTTFSIYIFRVIYFLIQIKFKNENL